MENYKVNILLFIFVLVVILIFLLTAFFVNFTPGEPMIKQSKSEHIREKNIYYESIDKINMTPSLEPINYKLLSNRKGEINNIFSEVIFIKGNIELGHQLENNCLIELNEDKIYNIILNKDVNDSITIFIWNNSKVIKGVKFHYKINGKETKMITLQSNIFVSLDYKDNSWNLNDMTFFENNRDIYNKYITKRCYNVLMSDIMIINEKCNNIVKELNEFINNNHNLSETDRLKSNTEYKNKCVNDINMIFNSFNEIKSKELIERLIKINGCIFVDCNFFNDDDLLKKIEIMIKNCLDELNEEICEYTKMCNFMLDNILIKYT